MSLITPYYAEIIVPLFLPKNYLWAIPEALQPRLSVGARVEVMLRNKKYTGVVKRFCEAPPEGVKISSILSLVDEQPIVLPYQLKFWSWMADYYMCTEGEIMQVALPTNFKLSSESLVIFNEETDFDWQILNDEEYIITDALSIRKELRFSELGQLIPKYRVYAVVKSLIDKNICFIWEELKRKYKEKKEDFVLLHVQWTDEEKLANLLNNWKGAPKQMDLLLSYFQIKNTEGEVAKAALLKKANATSAQLNALLKKEIFIIESRSVDRIKALPPILDVHFNLSEAQQYALDKVEQYFAEQKVTLLHGVTASGKTQIYIKLLEKTIQSGKQALYMLPEIALTTQIIRRLQAHFGGNIVVYHSKLNPNERVEIWNKVKSGDIKIVLGARSALFLPFLQLGLIVVDEEHDNSYKQQEPAPRYNARDAAIVLAIYSKANVLLGSATPSVETYYNATSGKYGLVELTSRYGNVSLPAVECIDINEASLSEKKSERPMLSSQLIERMKVVLHQHQQVILFQNRRGYTPYHICLTCGWIPQCTDCDVSLTYHKTKNILSCHYCGKTYPLLYTCKACGAPTMYQKKFGTEKIEEAVASLFPEYKVARMDYDAIKGKADYDNIIKKFEEKKIDILVGTQMLVKGLDFDAVGLVGIIDADGLLGFSDFRVNERAFQLMTQVSGRAGRRDKKGAVLIQVSNVKHPVLQFVQNHDYFSLYSQEIENRFIYKYPPFTRMVQLIFKHRDALLVEKVANAFVQDLKRYEDLIIVGPSLSMVARIRNQYIYDALIKLPKDVKKINTYKQLLKDKIAMFKTDKSYSNVMILANVDPL